MSVLIAGSLALDTIETPEARVENVVGGSASFAMVAASFFSPVQLVGVVGEDFPPAQLEFFRSRGIDLQGLQRLPGKTFRWSGKYLPGFNERVTLCTELNVSQRYQPKVPQSFRRPEVLFLANDHPRLQRQVLDQVEKAGFVICDTMNLWINTARDELQALLPKVDLLMLNDEEARLLTGEGFLLKAGRRLLDQAGPRAVIIKKGEHGALLLTPDQVFLAPAFPLEGFKDPTGAGDTFAGALAGALARAGGPSPLNLRRAMIYGAVVASFTVEDFSFERLRTLTAQEIEDRFHRLREMVAFD
jgi:sugar/nucleoside kinase (ribokinase family)